MQTPAITLWFPEQCLLGFFILKKQLTSQDLFLIRSELSITAYPFLVLYRSDAPILNNDQLYIMGAGEYLEPGLFILDHWDLIVYNFLLLIMGSSKYLEFLLWIIGVWLFIRGWLNALRMNLYNFVFRIHFWVFVISKFCTIHIFFASVWKIWYKLYRFPPTWSHGGFPFLDLKLCPFSMQAQFHTNSFFDFVLFWIANFCGSHFIFLMVVNSHYDCLSLRVLLSYYQQYLRKMLNSDNIIAVMNRWLCNYACKLLVVAFEKPSTWISCSFENLPCGEFEIFSFAKICCAISHRLACLTHPCSIAILLLGFLVWPSFFVHLASDRSLTLVRNSALTLTWCAGGWCFVQ